MAKRFTRDSEEKKQAIHDSFQELLGTNGYDRVTMRQIAEKAGISVGIIYHYFPEGKASIAASLYELNLLNTLDINNYIGYRKENLREQITRHLQLHKENRELYRAFDSAIYANKDLFAGTKRKRDQVLREQLDSPERLEEIKRVYATIDSIIHRHLFVEPLFNDDDSLIDYLTVIAEAAVHAETTGISHGRPTGNL